LLPWPNPDSTKPPVALLPWPNPDSKKPPVS
jgi:hypothetical protein